jgi:hypothetical protein
MSDVSLTVTGLPFKFTGCTFTYAPNMIPTAVLSVDPAVSDLCNIESLRRKEVSICAKTPSGSLRFFGLFDGLQISQTPGGLSFSAVVKSQFQRLLEVYTIFPGLHPISANPFQQVSAFTSDPERVSSLNFGLTEIILFNEKTKVSLSGMSFPRAILEVLKAGLKAQEQFTYTTNAGGSSLLGNPDVYDQVFKNKNYAENRRRAIQLLEAVDISAVESMVLTPQDVTAQLLLKQMLFSSNTSVWQALVSAFNAITCNVVVANNKIFVLPANAFYKVPETKFTTGTQPKDPNVFSPAQYRTFQAFDNGYIDIGAVFMAGNLMSQNAGIRQTGLVGSFSPEDSKGAAVYVEELPYWLSEFQTAIRSRLMSNKRKIQAGREANLRPGYSDEEAAKDAKMALMESERLEKDANNSLKAIYDAYAQARYYQLKYNDRTGSLSTVFSNRVVPGSVGVVYSAFPRVRVDCFVSQVQHTIDMSPPNSGVALTSVSLSACRVNFSSTIEKDLLFLADYQKIKGVQEKFLSDLGG